MKTTIKALSIYFGIYEESALDLLRLNWIPVTEDNEYELTVHINDVDRLTNDLKKANILKEDLLDYETWYALVYSLDKDMSLELNHTLQNRVERYAYS